MSCLLSIHLAQAQGPPDTVMYYVNCNIKEVSDNFNKYDFLNLVNQSKFKKIGLQELSAKLIKVEKSFPKSKTNFLQHSLSVYYVGNDLVNLIGDYKDVFNLVEKTSKPQLLYTPNDYGVPATYNSAHLDLVNAREAFEITKGDPRILIGITDTYIEPTHDDLQSKIQSILSNGNNVGNWHGVAVSSCAAAATDNGKGIASIGFNSKIVFDDGYGFSSTIQNMITKNPKIRVVNCSWLNECQFLITEDALYKSLRDDHNVVIVAGAGNTSSVLQCGSLDAPVYPGAYDAVICVTTVGHLSPYGYVDPTYGANNWKDCHEQSIGDPTSAHHHYPEVDICAPGYNVLCAMPNNTYGGAWGTSFSSPMVAGVCALVAAVDPCLTAVEIQDIVVNTADASIYQIPENQKYLGLLGIGRLDAYQAVKRALDKGTAYVQNKVFTSSTAITVVPARTILYSGLSVTNTLPYGVVLVKSGANVRYEATNSIVLASGFEVQQQANFEAKIIDSPCF